MTPKEVRANIERLLPKKKAPVNKRHGVDIYSLPDEGYNWCLSDSADLLSKAVAVNGDIENLLLKAEARNVKYFIPIGDLIEALTQRYLILKKEI